MVKSELDKLNTLINSELKPYVNKIDKEAFYAEHFLRTLGEEGFYLSTDRSLKQVLSNGLKLVEETAKTCMTTAFCLWCHLAALTYVRNSENDTLKKSLLPLLESGKLLGGTGLSNPMKYYAELEKLHLKAEKVDGGYEVTGVLPAVSNLANNHVFAFIAEVNEAERIMGFVPFQADGLETKEKTDYLGLNGSATFACKFNRVFIPLQQIVSENADTFVEKIRPTFILYQIPLGIGIIEASIDCIDKVRNSKNGCNQFLPVQADELRTALSELQSEIQRLDVTKSNWHSIASVRLKTVYVTLRAVEAAMIHQGGAGYLKYSHVSRRLREAYFFANLTPTIKHLEKLLSTARQPLNTNQVSSY